MTVIRPVRMATAIALILALPVTGGCEQRDTTAATSAKKGKETPSASPVSFERETPAFAFTYEYPSAAAAIPALAARLDTERARALAELEASAAEAQADAKANGYPYMAHMMGVRWKVTGNNPAILAMVGEISSFSGGAHGMTGYEALIWDKAASAPVTLNDLFTDANAALGEIRDRYCMALTAERATKRGDQEMTGDDMFTACPAYADLVIVPYTGTDGGFDRMMFIAAPYVAGPYVEGTYEVSVPITPAMLALVKPAYRNAFASVAP